MQVWGEGFLLRCKALSSVPRAVQMSESEINVLPNVVVHASTPSAQKAEVQSNQAITN